MSSSARSQSSEAKTNSSNTRRRSSVTTRRERSNVQFRPVVEVVDHDMDVSLTSLDPSMELGADTELGLGNSSHHSTSARNNSSGRAFTNGPLLGETSSDGSSTGDEDLLMDTANLSKSGE